MPRRGCAPLSRALHPAEPDGARPASHRAAAMSPYWPSLPIVTLVLMTMVLWFQARRTRALVDRAVNYATRAGNFARFFSPTVARCLAMNGTGNGQLGERCQIAVLFADIGV